MRTPPKLRHWATSIYSKPRLTVVYRNSLSTAIVFVSFFLFFCLLLCVYMKLQFMRNTSYERCGRIGLVTFKYSTKLYSNRFLLFYRPAGLCVHIKLKFVRNTSHRLKILYVQPYRYVQCSSWSVLRGVKYPAFQSMQYATNVYADTASFILYNKDDEHKIN